MVEEKADQQSEADAKQEQPLSYPLSKLLHFVALSAAGASRIHSHYMRYT
jgi:hypothetical protein